MEIGAPSMGSFEMGFLWAVLRWIAHSTGHISVGIFQSTRITMTSLNVSVNFISDPPRLSGHDPMLMHEPMASTLSDIV